MGFDLMVVESITYQKGGVLVITVNEGRIDGVRFLGLNKIKPFILSAD